MKGGGGGGGGGEAVTVIELHIGQVELILDLWGFWDFLSELNAHR